MGAEAEVRSDGFTEVAFEGGQAKSIGEHSGKGEEYKHRLVQTTADVWMSHWGDESGRQQA